LQVHCTTVRSEDSQSDTTAGGLHRDCTSVHKNNAISMPQELADVVAAWESLPASARRAILQIVEDAEPTPANRLDGLIRIELAQNLEECFGSPILRHYWWVIMVPMAKTPVHIESNEGFYNLELVYRRKLINNITH
jgi:hypothetical protein